MLHLHSLFVCCSHPRLLIGSTVMQYTGHKSGSSANAIFICNGTASALPDRQTGGQTEVQLQEEADEQTGRQRNRQTGMSAARTVICSVLVLQLAHTVVNLSGTSSARQTDQQTDVHFIRLLHFKGCYYGHLTMQDNKRMCSPSSSADTYAQLAAAHPQPSQRLQRSPK